MKADGAVDRQTRGRGAAHRGVGGSRREDQREGGGTRHVDDKKKNRHINRLLAAIGARVRAPWSEILRALRNQPRQAHSTMHAPFPRPSNTAATVRACRRGYVRAWRYAALAVTCASRGVASMAHEADFGSTTTTQHRREGHKLPGGTASCPGGGRQSIAGLGSSSSPAAGISPQAETHARGRGCWPVTELRSRRRADGVEEQHGQRQQASQATGADSLTPQWARARG